jgi:hypothetical protein
MLACKIASMAIRRVKPIVYKEISPLNLLTGSGSQVCHGAWVVKWRGYAMAYRAHTWDEAIKVAVVRHPIELDWSTR